MFSGTLLRGRSLLPWASLRLAGGSDTYSVALQFFQRYCSTQSDALVIAEHGGDKLLQGTFHSVTAASQLADRVTILVAGNNVQNLASTAAGIHGVKKVFFADDPCLDHQLAEPYAAMLSTLQSSAAFSHIVTSASSFGKNLLPRAAALLGVQPISDVVSIRDPLTFVRPMYAGNALATVKYVGAGPCMISVRPSGFPAAALVPAEAALCPVEAVPAAALEAGREVSDSSAWIGQGGSASLRPDLGAAKVVVSGGRALKNAENFKILERIADMLGGAVGATRAAVDAGFVSNDLQVGQTGKIVAPDLYFALGISGAIQHLAGIKDSKTIVAINTDPDAPIFQVADYGLVMDLFEALPQLEEEIKKLKSEQ